MPLSDIENKKDLKTDSVKQGGASMSEKLLASPDILNGIRKYMKRSDVTFSGSEDFDNSDFEEPDDLHEFETYSVLAKSENNMMPSCISCGKKMEFVEGDVIYGENWYHSNCWKATNAQLIL